jgi:protocatechuate 4,5-dioxygenase alpha subunit
VQQETPHAHPPLLARRARRHPGTTVFNALRSRQAYHLHKFCMSLMQPSNREAFRADERAYLDASG